MSKTKVIEVENITKSYGEGDNNFTVLNGISFDIDSGEFIIFFGQSGCGKSTLLNVICGLETVDTGKVSIRGEDISKFTQKELAFYRRTKIGIVFQQFNLLKNLTNKGNVALPLLSNGEPLKRAEHRAGQLLDMFGLEKHANKLPTELSGGQQQRVAMARALSANPWIIVADEPTGNLDSKSADEVIEMLNILNKKSKRTVIMVTHNPDYIKYADRVIHMKDGKILKEQKNAHTVPVKDIEGFDPKEHVVEG
jgi:putative ABC transport system ATP-binding protein